MSEAVTATVLFTDLVGSTALASRVGPDVAEELRSAHFGLLRGAISETAGTEVKNLGDGLMAAFTSPSRAVECAVAMQQAIERHNRRGGESFGVRIGLSSGECIEEDGDYFGEPVVEAARLCAVAEPGQILITELLRMMVGRHVAHPLVALGPRELKGLPDPVDVVEVVWEPDTANSRVMPLPARIGAAQTSDFVGRSAELAQLAEALKHAEESARRRVSFLVGEAGIGKTTLLARFVCDAHSSGALVLYGRCDEDLSVPYQPWVEALTDLVLHASDELLDAHVRERGDDLAALVPALATRIPDLPAGRSSDPETERHLLFGAVVDLLVRASDEAPVVLVLDDLHWSDRPTLQLLRHVAGAVVPLRLLVLGTFRDGDIGAGHPLTDLLAALHREEGVERIALQGLDDLELLALMESAAGHEMDDEGIVLRDGLRVETNGNPFFALEILRHLAETGAIVQGDDGRWSANVDLRAQGLPISVREVVGRRIERLAPDATRVLSAAAIIGRDFDLRLLAEVTESSEDDLLDLLDQAEQAAIVMEAPGGADRYTFVHALIQRALYDDLSAARRRRLHRRVAEAIESVVSDPAERVAELARHWYAATEPVDVRKAYQYSLAAGDQALARLAPDEAVRWFTQALELVDRVDLESDAGHCDVLTRLGGAQRLAGDAGFRETLLDAAHRAARLGDTGRLVAAALGNSRGFFSSVGDVDHDRVEVLNAALRAVSDTTPGLRARLLAQMSTETMYTADVDTPTLLDEALRLARESRDDAALFAALHALHDYQVPHNLALRLDTAEYSALVARGDPAWSGWAAADMAQGAMETGDVDGYRRECEEIARVAADVGDPSLRWLAALYAHAVPQLRGDLEEAERLAEVALQLGLDGAQPDAFEGYAGQLLELRLIQGRAGEIVDLVAETADENPGVPTFRAALAACLGELDRTDEARAILDDFVEADLDQLLVDPQWLACLTYLAQACSDCDHRDAAAQLEALLAPFRNQYVWAAVMMIGPVATALAGVETVLERWDDVDATFADALARSERLGSPYWTAFTQHAWAHMLCRRNRDGDTERAQTLLRAALDGATQHGFATIQRRATLLLGS